MAFVIKPIPSIPEEEVAAQELTYKAFLSHEGAEKRTVVDLLRKKLRRYGISDEKVFYDGYMTPGGSRNEELENRLKNGLLASEFLIAFLTPNFLKKKWPLWELRTFLDMMEKDGRRKLLPVFYKVSAGGCGDIAKPGMGRMLMERLGFGKLLELLGLEQVKNWAGLDGDSAELRRMLGKVKRQVGIDAESQRLSDGEVVTRIMRAVFNVDIRNGRATESVTRKDHSVRDCSDPLCEFPTCADSIKSRLDKFFAVPELPTHAKLDVKKSGRPEKVLKDKLLSEASSALTAFGVKGMGGVGKTTCLIGVANDPEVGEKFSNGVLWIQLSMHTKFEDVREVFVNILKYAWYNWKGGNPEVALNPRTSLDEIVESIRKSFTEKRCLIVLDDFWPFDDYRLSIAYFKQTLSYSSKILLSTRYSEVLGRFNAAQIDVGDLDDETASALFDDWCGETPVGEKEEALKKKILKLCSNVALAVCIAGSNVKRIAKLDGKEHGLERVLGKLERNVDSLKKLDHVRGDQMLNAVIETTLDSMTNKDDKNGYERLAVFNSKTRIPNQALEALWSVDADIVEDRVDLYVACSLATRKVVVRSGCTSSFYVEFHDQHLAYARYCWCRESKRLTAGKRSGSSEEEMLTELHAELVDGYRELHQGVNVTVWWEAEELNDGYFYESYARHLAKSERIEDLVLLFTDYRWIAIRCRRQDITGLLEDFDLAISTLRKWQTRKSLKWNPSSSGERSTWLNEFSAADVTGGTSDRTCDALRLVQKALRASQVSLWKCRDEAPFQLVGRLRAYSSESPLIKRLIDSARRWVRQPWLYPVAQCFESPMSGALQVLPAGSFVCSVAVISERHRLVACGTYNGHIRLWDWNTGRSVWWQKCHENEVSSLEVRKDGRVMVSGSRDRTVRLWDVKSGEYKGVLRGHDDGVSSVAVMENGNVLVSGSEDKTVRIWHVKSGSCKRVLLGHESAVRSVAATEDGSVVVSGSWDRTVRVWSVESEKCRVVLQGHEDKVSSVAVTEDGNTVVSGSWDKTIRIWNVDRGECNRVLLGHEGVVWSVAVTEDRGVVVSGSGDKTARLWSVESGKCIRVFLGHERWVSSVTVTEDRSVVVSGSEDKTVRIWNAESGECKRLLEGHEDWVNSIDATEDGSVVVTGSDDKAIRIWDVESGKCKGVLLGHEASVTSVAVTEDGNVVVSGSLDTTVRVWDVESGKCKRVLQGHEHRVVSIAVTDDGSVLVSGSSDKTVRIWDMESGKCKRVLLGHERPIRSVALPEEGNFVVSGSWDGAVRIWNVESGKCKGVLLGHEGPVWSVAVTEDGGGVVSASYDNTVRIWNVQSGKCVKTLTVDRNMRDSFVLVNRELLRWARSHELLASHDKADFGDSGSRPALPGGCEIKVECEVVKIVRGEDCKTVMSATFDSEVQSALAVTLNGKRRVVAITRFHVFTLEIVNPDRFGKETGLIGEAGGG